MPRETMAPNPHHRGFAGDDMPVKPQSAFAPLIERVAVPAMWFGLGYLAAVLMSKKKTV